MSSSGRFRGVGSLARHEAAARSALISHVRYHVALDFAQAEDEFRCTATIRFRADVGNTVTFLDYAGIPQSVECNGFPVGAVAHHGARLYLPTVAGENVVRVVGTGHYGRVGAGLHRFRDPVDGQVYLHTRFEPFEAHRVYPCFDQPDLKATLRLTVTVDDLWQVIANTVPAAAPERMPGGRAVWTFVPTPPLPPHLTALVAGPFHRVSGSHGDLSLALYAREALMEELKADAGEMFDVIAQGLDFYAELLDRPYPFVKYDHVFAPECAFPALKHPGCVTVDERFLFRSRVTRETRRQRAEVLLDGMAQMWFGNLVGVRWWDDRSLNEGLTTLMAALAQPKATPFGEAWALFEHRAGAAARQADRMSVSPPVVSGATDTDSVRLDLGPVMAGKAAAVLRQLAECLGWENFVSGLRRYLRDHAWSTAELGDFIRAVQRSATADLTEWADEWLRRPGVTTVEVCRLRSGHTTVQLADPRPEARQVRLRIGCYAGGDADLRFQHRFRVSVDQRGEREDARNGPRRVFDLVLPNEDGLSYVKIRLDPRSRRTVMSGLSALADPTARAVAWGSLWDDVLDARLAARAYVAVVLAHAPAEEDVGILGLLWDRAVVAAQVYGQRSNAVPLLRAIGRRLGEELDRAAAGSDHQLVLAQALTSSATGEYGGVSDLARGRRSWPGLRVDRDLRWRALVRLAGQGQPTDDLLAAELAADPGDDGRRRALLVEAARPQPRAKGEAWRRVLSGAHSLAERRAVMAGFQQPGQEAVLTPFAERYFATLEHVWESAGPESALAVARALYPLFTNAEHEVLARTDEMVEQARLPGELLGVLREKRAELALVLAARARDLSHARTRTR
ncbi:MAG TPA: aminopeptidase N [Amycolatopsis sp.]|nr:aminopeptidase N [Amycolatopsis sp.]